MCEEYRSESDMPLFFYLRVIYYFNNSPLHTKILARTFKIYIPRATKKYMLIVYLFIYGIWIL